VGRESRLLDQSGGHAAKRLARCSGDEMRQIGRKHQRVVLDVGDAGRGEIVDRAAEKELSEEARGQRARNAPSKERQRGEQRSRWLAQRVERRALRRKDAVVEKRVEGRRLHELAEPAAAARADGKARRDDELPRFRNDLAAWP